MTRDELIEKMYAAYDAELNAHRGLAAALDVALAEVLEEPTREETKAAGLSDWGHDASKELFASRRARYAKGKTPEERIRHVATDVGHYIEIDGGVRFRTVGTTVEDADAVVLGLIQQLKEGK